MKKIINMILFSNIILTLFCITIYYSSSFACVLDDFVTTNQDIELSSENSDEDINLIYIPEEVPDGNSDFSDAITIKEDVKYTYTFQNESDIDYYYFSPDFANYYSITSLNNNFSATFYNKNKEYIGDIEKCEQNANIYLENDTYILLSASGHSGNYSFKINENNTYEGFSYTHVMSQKKFYGIKRANLTSLTYINVYIDDSMAKGYSTIANYPMLTLYYNAIEEINKLGYIRFKESKESEASIKIYYGENKVDGTKLDDNILGLTTFDYGFRKVKSSTIVYNSTRFSGDKSISFYNYECALQTVIHELLHSIGLDHIESSNDKANEENVMYYKIVNDGYKKFGAFDIASYREVWG